jgi:hypothetical protein
MKIQYGAGLLLLVLTTGCGQSSSPVMPGPSCSYALSPTVQPVPMSGGTFTATLTTSAGCAWTAAADASWITISSGSSGTMAGTLTYSVPANSGDIRRGTVAAQATGRTSATTTVIQDGVNY